MARQAFEKQAEVSPTTRGIAEILLGKPGRPSPVRRSMAACADRNVPPTTELTLPGGLRPLFGASSLSDENLRN
jgi:hypothetical protein